MQPVSGGQVVHLSGTAAGTTVLIDRPCVVERFIIPASATGTVTIHDSATGSTGAVFVLVNDTVDFPTSLECGFQLRNGLSYVTGGTTSLYAVVR